MDAGKYSAARNSRDGVESFEGHVVQGVDAPADARLRPRRGSSRSDSPVARTQPASRSLAVNPAERPRHPDLIARDRRATATTFVQTVQRACSLASEKAVAPEDAAAALLAAASLSDEHNRHCRAGIPIDGAVQQARRDLQQAVAALLALEDLELSRRDELLAAGQGIARFTANPLARLPVVVIHTAVARWLAPDDADVMRVAFNDPALPAHERLRIEHRVAVTSAR
jgi:hypothetical protein